MVIGVVVVLGGAMTRGDGREDLAPQKVHIQLGVLATGAGHATYPSGEMASDLAIGESQVWGLAVSPGEAAGPGCATTVRMSPVWDGKVPEQAAHVWEARLTVRAAALERIELDVDWKRYVRRGADGEPRAVAGDRRSMVLEEGQRHLLDFVEMRSLPGWQTCYSLALELRASVAEDPALAGRRIAYDLWLVDENPGGRSATRRWQVTGKHGEAKDFDFETLRRSMPAGATGGEASAEIETRVSGQVRSRMRNDGSVEVALLARRQDSGEQRHWAIGGSGEKRVRVAAGETIRLELPTPKEAPGYPGKSAADIDADQKIVAALQERTVSLVLTTRPVE
jgi:hypothetical protein